VRHRPDVDPFDTLKLLIPVAAALDLMHSGRATGNVPVVHRDVKPSNIVITEEGSLLVDFGLTRGLPTGQRISGVSGTLGYLAPEATDEGIYTPATDRFALGAVAYFILTGLEPPITHQPDVLRAGLAAVPALRDRPEALDHVMAMLAADPASRPEGLANWVGQLRRSSLAVLPRPLAPEAPRRQPGSAAAPVLGGQGLATAARPPEQPDVPGRQPSPPSVRRRAFVGAAAAAVVAAVAAVTVQLIDSGSTNRGDRGSIVGPTTTVPASTPTTVVPVIAPATTAPASALPPAGPIPAGIYQPKLQPTMQLRLGDGWEYQGGGTVDGVDSFHLVRSGASRQTMSVARVTGLYRDDGPIDEAQAGDARNVQAVPADLAAALGAHRQLTVNASALVTVGGVPGVRLDVTASGNTRSCSEPCVLLFPSVEPTNRFALFRAKKNVLYVLRVRGEPIVISAEADPAEFNDLHRLVEDMLLTVRFPA
jgi:hypothetical protein